MLSTVLCRGGEGFSTSGIETVGKGIVSNATTTLGVTGYTYSVYDSMFNSLYELLSGIFKFIRYVSELLNLYEKGGAAEVSRFVMNTVSSTLKRVYERFGLPFNGEVSFSRLVDAGIIDESMAVYLIATYMAIENSLAELEDVEETGNEEEVRKVLASLADKLQELIGVLEQIEMSMPTYYIEQTHYAPPHSIMRI